MQSFTPAPRVSCDSIIPQATSKPPDMECHSALLACIEILEKSSEPQKPQYFRIENIQESDKLVSFYTGFVSYMVFSTLFEFLGQDVDNLDYWGSSQKMSWMPSVEQVKGTLPTAFRDKYPTTYAIINGSKVFLETPSDLAMQSSTWSQYKHHSTVKFLVACTPNRAICFVSPAYVGSISDVELTRINGLFDALRDKSGVSTMADKGFTIRELLRRLMWGSIFQPFYMKSNCQQM
uniref:DDE Tnp4 domain-containing protein n=1 Tax=Amphimedon queenslandica TaxID=400682 RepID=A0A1X7VVM3_AMPQE